MHEQGHARLSVFMANLADVLTYRGELQEAEQLVREARAMERRLGLASALTLSRGYR